ncbi:hypothetical protein CEK26_002297 [Fusarium fujikuroi]|uniref:Uncharacterized protein n=1 Tax=Fusarium fujikuroi TaxID=5127 RepID=A0A0I9YFZ8_FUSFU|nr:Uncharacterized protein Y057_6189 [Fusarium fujikuroi]KLO94941.1 Uncharacterized protein LW93_3634 [Fusarium fujikuroi]QGI69964.1 hypothetical protein CEK27_002293 [Fusarium fujikuroi]QGI87335.1 hypothetical protein CEK25_002291 [Fusarium fujikuroi]QGJ00853.1 hypothetical protein CEK26_002297 [Fusarium fujikuroi]
MPSTSEELHDQLDFAKAAQAYDKLPPRPFLPLELLVEFHKIIQVGDMLRTFASRKATNNIDQRQQHTTVKRVPRAKLLSAVLVIYE